MRGDDKMKGKVCLEEWKEFVNGRIESLTQGNKVFVDNFPNTLKHIGDPNISKSGKGGKGLWYELWTFFNLTEMLIDEWDLDDVYYKRVKGFDEIEVVDEKCEQYKKKNPLYIDWKGHWNAGKNLKDNLKQTLPTLSMKKDDKEVHIWLQYWLSNLEAEEGSRIDLAVGFGELNVDLKYGEDELEKTLISLDDLPIFKWEKNDDRWYHLENMDYPDVIIECKSSQINKKQIEKYSSFDAEKHLLIKYGGVEYGDLDQFDLITETNEDFRNKRIREYLKQELQEFIT